MNTSRKDEEVLSTLPKSAEITEDCSSIETSTTELVEALDEASTNQEEGRDVVQDDVRINIYQ